jgi:hypothetical protein
MVLLLNGYFFCCWRISFSHVHHIDEMERIAPKKEGGVNPVGNDPV